MIARQQDAELQAEHRDHRNQAVLQDVLVDDLSFAQSLGARRAHIVFVELLDDARSHHSRQDRGQRRAHRDGGQEQILRSVPPRDRQQVEPDREEIDHQRAEHEPRRADAEQRRNRGQAVDPGPLISPRRDAERDRDQDRDGQPRQRQLDRRGIAIENPFENPIGRIDQADAEISAQDAAPVLRILLRQRPVHAEPLPQLPHLFLRGIVPERIAHRIARNDVDQQKDQRDDRPDDRQHQRHPSGQRKENGSHVRDDSLNPDGAPKDFAPPSQEAPGRNEKHGADRAASASGPGLLRVG